jgi:cytochrome P450
LSSIWRSNWQHRLNHKPFEKLGEVFLAVSYDHYKVLNMYGNNILTTEGATWRMHRKITSASFNEKNAALIFHESINQTKGLLSQWEASTQGDAKTIKTLEHDTMSLMLHIIGYAGFGIKFLFEHQEVPADADPKTRKFSGASPPEGHSLTFKAALSTTLEYLLLLMLAPRWLLRRLLPHSAMHTTMTNIRHRPAAV